MTTMIPDLVVGSVGFGSNFADNTASLEAQVRELIRSNNRLIRVISRCVKPSNEVANEASDAIEEATAIR
jgi:predicted alternative tryptophan synthase beta-subunit